MPLDLTMMYSAVTICGDKVDDAGQAQRVRNGTGFIMTIRTESGRLHGYVVTAHHVIAPLTNIEVEIANPYQVGELYPPEPLTDWRRSEPYPEADLAFVPFSTPEERSSIAIRLGSQVIHDLEVKLGADFHYIGLLAPLGVPMARSGTIGALDVPGIRHDGPYEYDAHLVDVRSYGGFSGAPCYLEYPFANLEAMDRRKLPTQWPESFKDRPIGAFAYMYLFGGMFTEHFSDKRMSGFASTLGTGVVLPANTIIETLMTDKLQHERREDDKRFIAAHLDSPIEAVSAGKVEQAADSGHEFERFEDLAQKLVQVPKRDLDEKRSETD